MVHYSARRPRQARRVQPLFGVFIGVHMNSIRSIVYLFILPKGSTIASSCAEPTQLKLPYSTPGQCIDMSLGLYDVNLSSKRW